MSKTVSLENEPLSAGDVARMFGVDPKTVARWANRGLLPSFRTPGGHRRFRRVEVEEVLASSVTVIDI